MTRYDEIAHGQPSARVEATCLTCTEKATSSSASPGQSLEKGVDAWVGVCGVALACDSVGVPGLLEPGMASSTGVAFLDHFAALRDPRQSWKVVYPLSEVLLTVLSGTIAGAEDFVEIRRWAVLHMDFLRRFLPFANGIPSHDTLRA